MSAPVDVLAVMRWASVSADAATESRECDEARAAVAELIEAAEEKLADLSPDGIGHYRLRDAIASCKGAQS